nr:MFS transporter [Streptomyces sp. TRM68416]
MASVFLAAYAGFLPAGGRFADRWGRCRMFCTGVALFGAGSLAAAPAQESLLLVAARAVQGLGAAATAPAAVALIVTGFPAARPATARSASSARWARPASRSVWSWAAC